MNAQIKSFKSKSSANRAAKAELGAGAFEVFTNEDGTFSYRAVEPPTEGEIEQALVEDEQGPPAEIQEAGDNAANGLQVTEAGPTTKKVVNVKRKSDIEKPTKKVWALAEAKLEIEPGIRRKDMVEYLVGCGIAFYTARTQYQLYLAAVKASTPPTSPVAG